MAKARSLVGLDVHATKIVAAVLDAQTGQLQHFRSGGDVAEAAGLCAGLARQPAEAIAVAWSAQQRLHRTWQRLEARGKRRTIIAVAGARELTGFCWAIWRIE